MARKNYTLKDAFSNWPSKQVAIAFLLNVGLVSYLNEAFPDLLSILLGVSIVLGVSYAIGDRVGSPTLLNTIGVGAISYAAYLVILVVTKLYVGDLNLVDELTIAASFGVWTGLVYQVMEYFR